MPGFRRVLASTMFAILLCPYLHSTAFADGPSTTSALTPLVVSATRIPTPEDEVGSSITLITAEDIARKQERTLPDLLRDVPGLNVVQTGSPGGVTSVFTRGTNANHTKVFVDGIDVSDPSTPNDAFDYSQLLASDIERVEVLRGPQSGLYGSDAIGGVINVITKKGEGPVKLHASLEGGSFGTFNQTAGLRGSASRFDYTFDFQHFRSGDTPVTPRNLIPPGRSFHDDAYDNKSYSTKLGARITDNFDIGAVARYIDTMLRSTSDDFLGPEDEPSHSDNHDIFTRGWAHSTLFSGALDQTFGVGYTRYHRRYFDPNPGSGPASLYRGDRVKLDYQGNVILVHDQILTFGAEHQVDGIDDSTLVRAHQQNDAGFAQLQSAFGRLFNTLSLRYDHNSRFGGKATFRVAPSLLIGETGTRLKGSVGTGFKAPSLDQLFTSYPQFNFFANPNLKPEKSLGWDLGFEQDLLDKQVKFGATYFDNHIKDLIDYNDTFTTQINIGKAQTHGVESFVSYAPLSNLDLRADYTHAIARDEIRHQDLLHRPKNKASLNASWRPTAQASLSATVIYTGSAIDIARSGFPSGLTRRHYTLVDLAGSYDLGHGVTAFARIDNLLDRDYRDPIGFRRPGFGGFAGIRVELTPADWRH